MITPFAPEELFEIDTSQWEIVHTPNDEDKHPHVIIDNFYKNFDDIREILNNMPVEKYKNTPSNFVKYYDCRPRFLNTWQIKELTDARLGAMWEIVAEHLCRKKERTRIKLNTEFEFNYFQPIQTIPQNMQHAPHRDPYDFTFIIYLDDVCDGGTMLYEEAIIRRNDEMDIIVDVDRFTPAVLLEAKPNRCAIFYGDQVHGGWINDYEAYRDNWRINQVVFCEIS